MPIVIQRALSIGAGGFVGALARWGVVVLLGRWPPIRFPLGTFVINISGSFLLGWFLAFMQSHYPSSGDKIELVKLGVATGFLGAYTTFSTFMYESSSLIDDGAGLEALANLVGSLVIGLLAFRLGTIVAR